MTRRDPHCGYNPSNCPFGDACADCREDLLLADPTHVVVTDGSEAAERDVYSATIRAASRVLHPDACAPEGSGS